MGIVAVVGAAVCACWSTPAFAHGDTQHLDGAVDEQLAAIHGSDGHPESLRVDLLNTSNTSTPSAEMARAQASVNDIVCNSAVKHVVLVYAVPTDRPDRYATVAPLLRQAIYEVSAFYESEGLSRNDTQLLRLHVACTGGLPDVYDVNLTTAAAATTFSTIRGDVRAASIGNVLGAPGLEHVVVFADVSVGVGTAGIGTVVTDDSTGPGNQNMWGGAFAEVYAQRDTGTSNLPRWWTIMHELGHTFGAVQISAPNASSNLSAAHCNDGLDTMCYSDGGSTSNYFETCTYVRFDCGNNDYFDPSATPNGYFATHWNIASSDNTYLEHTTIPGDVGTPTVPGNVMISDPGTANATLHWDASTDDVGTTGYAILRQIGTKFVLIGVDNGLSYPIGIFGGVNHFQVIAFDAVGHESAPVTVAMSDSDANASCGTPTRPVIAAHTSTFDTATATWTSSDLAGCVTAFEFLRKSGTTWKLVKSTHSRQMTMTGLLPGKQVVLGVRAIGVNGSRSLEAQIAVTTKPDKRRPTAPAPISIASRAPAAVSIRWGRSTDDWQVASYVVELRQIGGVWHRIAATTDTARRATLTIGSARGQHQIRVRAIDRSHKSSRWSRTFTV